MEQAFVKTGRSYTLLVRPRRPLSGKEVTFSDRGAAASFLRACLHDPATLRCFRDCLARLDATVGQKVGRLTDPQVLEAVSTGLFDGTLVLVEDQQGASIPQHPLTPISPTSIPRPPPGKRRPTSQIADPGGSPGLSPKGQEVSRRHLDRLEGLTRMRVQDLFNPNVRTMGDNPFLKQLTQDQALSWTKDYMLDMPLVDSGIGRSVGGMFNLDDAQLTLSPKELGKDAGEQIGGWADGFSADHPLLVYGSATLAAVGAGALTYSQGTKYLDQLGATKLKQSLFGDRVALDERFSFGPKLSDPTGSLTAREKVGQNLSLWQKVEGGGASFSEVDVTKYGLGADYKLSDALSVGGGYNSADGRSLVNGYLEGQSGGTSYRLDALYDLGSGDHQVSAYAGKQFSNGGFVEGFARYESWGGQQEGVAGVMAGFKF